MGIQSNEQLHLGKHSETHSLWDTNLHVSMWGQHTSNLDLRFRCHNDHHMPLSYYMHVIAVDQLVYVHLKCMFPTLLLIDLHRLSIPKTPGR